MNRLTARELITVVTDGGSWRPWDTTLPRAEIDLQADPAYAKELADARAKTGLDEAVTTGAGMIGGHRVAIVVCEFEFLGGTIGIAAADRITAAIRKATAERLPLLMLPTSGGTRMQEGTHAFLQMVRITAAVTDHKDARLPYLVYLRHPTTGGVFASWGSLGHLTLAEPAAMIGFLGPRVYQAIHGSPFPSGVQTSENLHHRGLVDSVCPPGELAATVADVLDILARPATRARHQRPAHPGPSGDDVPAWTSVLATRHRDRPGTRDILRCASRAVPLHGTGEGEAEDTLIVALARFGDAPCVLVGQDRDAQAARGAIGPAALRQARRGMRLAAELDIPLVSLIDTPGGELSGAAEEGAIAGEIARCLADLITLDVPTLSILLGQGTGGAALALFPADRSVAATHAWLSPLPPEGASAILYRTVDRASELAARQGIRATDLFSHGAVDAVIPEYPDARREPGAFSDRVAATIRRELLALTSLDRTNRLQRRHQRFDRLATGRAGLAPVADTA